MEKNYINGCLVIYTFAIMLQKIYYSEYIIQKSLIFLKSEKIKSIKWFLKSNNIQNKCKDSNLSNDKLIEKCIITLPGRH